MTDLGAPLLLNDLADALRAQHPLVFLEAASSLAQVTAPDLLAGLRPNEEASEPSVTREGLVESFLDVGERETDALLHVWAEMFDDSALKERLRTSGRRHSVPQWHRRLDQIRPVRVIENTHILGDGDNLYIGVETAGRSFTLVVYVDHNMGTIVKDCFATDLPIREMLARLDSIPAEGDTDLHEILLEDAAAKLTQAIDNGSRLLHPVETDSWPLTKPLLEWIVRLMPAGGHGYVYNEPTEGDIANLVEEFERSRYGEALDADGADRVRTLLDFAGRYGTGDPLRWSSVVVEIMLLDLIPRKILADDAYLRGFPDAVRAAVRFAHEQRSIPSQYTEQALAAVDEYEGEYLEAISQPRRTGAAALLERMGVLDALDDDYLLEPLAREVGGMEQLDALTTLPLPDEPLDVSELPADIVERVTGIATLTDAVCDGRFEGDEMRTVVRRLLSRVAAADPAIFRRRGKPETAAAAVCWIACKVNGWLDWGSDLTVAELMEEFGLTGSPTQRAQPMLRALGIDQHDWTYEPALGSADLLTSDYRADLIAQRDARRE